ncbi:MAG: PASTA domain-containing protein [Elusimicrobia bacterium]|nr:PASTA domain-containing protein [Elusimicrobiota bacterium]
MNAKTGKALTWEMAAVGAVFLAFSYWALNWGMEGLVHNRKTQTVPDLKGRSLAAALDMLSPLNIGLRKTGVEFDASVPIASILRQEPAAGTVVREGKTIRVVVSQGGQTVQAPSVLGLPLRNAEMLLRQSQLSLGEVSEAYSLKSEKGQVLSQDPKGETSVERDTLVNLVVSGGVPPAGVSLMPDFQRKTLDEVQAWAAGAGMKVDVKSDPSSLFPSGTVLTQDPAPDAALSPDGSVSVTVSGHKGAAPSAATKTFHYELAQGGSDSQVRIVLVDKYGERELFNGLRKPGSKIEVPVQTAGGARVKIYLNGILVEERDL